MCGLGGPRFFDVYVPALGSDIRIESADLFPGAGIELQAQWDRQLRALTLKVADCQGPSMPARDSPPYRREPENPHGLEVHPLPMTLKLFDKVSVVVYGGRGELNNYDRLHCTIALEYVDHAWVEPQGSVVSDPAASAGFPEPGSSRAGGHQPR